MKRSLFLQSCLMVCTLLSASPIEINGVSYELYGNRAMVTSGTDNLQLYSGDVIIPSHVVCNNNIYTVTKIGRRAFVGAYNLTSLSLPNTIDTIEGQAFQYMALDTLVIPSSVKYIGSNVIGELHKKNSNNEMMLSALSKLVVNCDSVCLGEYLWCNVLGGFVWDSEVSALKKIDCEVVWNVKYCHLEPGGFIFDYGGANVSKFEIGEKVDSVPSYLTWNNGSMAMETLVVGKNVRKIGNGAFAGCAHVKNVYWNAINVETNGQTNYGLDSVCNLVIGDGVHFLPEGFFESKNFLTSIEIPESVVEIRANAFANCHNVTQITSHSYMSPWFDPTAFYGISTPQDSVPVYIPCCALENYQERGWQNVGVLTEPATDHILTLASDNEKYGYVKINQRYSCCNSVAIFEAVPYAGYVFKEWNDGITTNPRTLVIDKDESFTAIFEPVADALVEVSKSANINKYIQDGTLFVKRKDNNFTATGARVK